jgi:Domain of unknown function (DUF4160)
MCRHSECHSCSRAPRHRRTENSTHQPPPGTRKGGPQAYSRDPPSLGVRQILLVVAVPVGLQPLRRDPSVSASASRDAGLPRISAFYGVIIYMYWNERDHPVAHFHAYHAGRRAIRITGWEGPGWQPGAEGTSVRPGMGRTPSGGDPGRLGASQEERASAPYPTAAVG